MGIVDDMFGDRNYETPTSLIGERPQGPGEIQAKAIARKKLEQARRTQERAAQAEAAALIELEEAGKLEEKLKDLQEDQYADNTLLVFQKRFKRGSRVYTYAAIKVDGLWFLTGPQQSGLSYTWDRLINFAVIDNGLTDVQLAVATAFEKVI